LRGAWVTHPTLKIFGVSGSDAGGKRATKAANLFGRLGRIEPRKEAAMRPDQADQPDSGRGEKRKSQSWPSLWYEGVRKSGEVKGKKR